MRIVGGEFRGRQLLSPTNKRVRPTTDLVREAVFDILGPVDDLNVLDLFCGSGSFGFEALSRGAAAVTFVDRARGLRLNENLEKLGVAGRGRFYKMSVERFLSRVAQAVGPWDLVYIDPPYAQLEKHWQLINSAMPALIRPQGRVVVEDRSNCALDLSNLNKVSEHVYGDTKITVFGQSAM